MRKIDIEGSDFPIPRLILGTSGLLKLGSERKIKDLFSLAIEQGISHFDTSPYYGFGVMERLLGEVFKENSGNTVTTKVGIYPPGNSERGLYECLALKILGRAIPRLTKAEIDYSVKRAKESLESSLRRLKRERVDLLMIHNPIWELVPLESWGKWVSDLHASGKIGAFGISSDWEINKSIQSNLAPFVRIRQGQYCVNSEVLTETATLDIVFGIISAFRKANSNIEAKEALISVLNENPNRPVIVSSRYPERIMQLVEAEESVS